MALVNVGDIVLVTQTGLLFGQRIMNTFHYQVFDITAPSLDTTTMANNIFGAWHAVGGMGAKLKACMPEDCALDETWVQKVAPTRIVKAVSNLSAGAGGRGTTTVTNVSASIERRGEAATRSAVGGVRIPITPDDVLGGEINSTLFILLTALAAQMNANIVGADCSLNPVIYAPPKPPSVIATLHDQLYTIVQHTSRVMGRRTVGRGI